MKKIILLIVSICILLVLTACGQPEITGYHIDENGKLIVTYEDNTTADAGTLTDTIANGANTITVNSEGYYVINGVVSKIKANLPESYAIDTNGNLIVTYTDTTTENLGKFGSDAINTINTIAISDDGFYVLNGIKTNIVAVDVFEVNFVTGYAITVKTQVVKDGDKVERPQLEREGYTLVGWYCNGEEWRFNSDLVLNEMTLTAEWVANDYTVNFNTGIDETLAEQTVAFDSQYSLPTLARDGYTFKGWEYDGKLVTSSKWNIAENTTLVAKWEVNTYTVSINANGGTVSANSVKVTYGKDFKLPVATNEYGAFIGWFYGETQITDAQGNSLLDWSYLNDIEVTTSWTIKLSSANDLQQLYQYPNGHFELTQNIDISLIEWIPVGTESNPFTGEINGCGYAINGLKITALQGTQKYYGFIGYAKSGKIYDLGLTNVNINLPTISNTVYVGGMIARNENASLENIVLSGNVLIANHSSSHESYAGGMIGYSVYDNIQKCLNYANVTAKNIAGGIIGYKETIKESDFFVENKNFGEIIASTAGGLIGDGVYCNVYDCINKGNVAGEKYAGGIVGYGVGVKIDRCANEGDITLSSTSKQIYDSVGGIVGFVYFYTKSGEWVDTNSIISNSYNAGTVTSVNVAGGILGTNWSTATLIQNCYNSGSIKGEIFTAGIAGYMYQETKIEQCVNYGKISSSGTAGTIAGSSTFVIDNCYYNCTTTGITLIQGSKTTEKYSKEFYTQTMFWDESIWNFYDDKLPTLK